MSVIIIAKNQTASDLPLEGLSAPDAKIPASGQVTLTDWNFVWEIQEDVQLKDYIYNDQVLLGNGVEDLTKEESQNFITPVASTTDPEFASTTDTGSGSGSAGALLALDGEGKADGRDIGQDGSILDSHVDSTSNPHNVTKNQIGLGDVTNDAQLKRSDNDFTGFTEDTDPDSADLVLVERSSDGAKRKVQLGNFPSQDNDQLNSASIYTAAQAEIDSTDWTDIAGSSFTLTTTVTEKIWAVGTFIGTTDAAGSGSEFEIRLVIGAENGNGSLHEPYNDLERTIVSQHLTSSAVAPGNYTIKAQARRVGGSDSLFLEDISIVAVGLSAKKGDKGDKGDTGSGSTLTIQEEGTPLPNTPHSTLNFVGSQITATDQGGGVAKIEVTTSALIFGSEFDEASSEIESSTTSSGYQQKLRLATDTLPAGKYRIGWNFQLRASYFLGTTEAQIELDDTDVLGNGGVVGAQGVSACGGYAYRTFGTAASHTIDIDYRSPGSGTAYISNARLEIWRVG